MLDELVDKEPEANDPTDQRSGMADAVSREATTQDANEAEPASCRDVTTIASDSCQHLPGMECSEVELLSKIAVLQRQLLDEERELRRSFDTSLKYDRAKERTIDLLHQELQQHRQGMHFTLLRPLFVDLISLHDDLMQMAELNAQSDDAGVAAAARNYASFVTTVEEILARNNVEVFISESDEFDGKRQRVVRTDPTTAPEQANRIAKRLRKGFSYEGRVLRPELVVAYRLTPPV